MGERLTEWAERPLNFSEDQRENLDPQLRRLNVRLGAHALLDFVLNPPAYLLLAGAVGLLAKRRFALASILAGGFVLQQALSRVGATGAQERLDERKKREIAFERRTMKAQRGDYGRLDVIAFK
ncbi:MAG: hypothetical protein FPO08_20180 [Geobacter sp.]|nr:MAG: hypothetical protein FPO08_20180 [Geobacter sp.]